MIGRLSACAAVCLLWAAPAPATAQTFDQEIYYQLRARHSGKCLDLPFSSIDNAVALQQWDCNTLPQANQLWTIVPTAPSATTFRIVSAASAKCLDIAGYSTANGAASQQYDCVVPDQQLNQIFSITNAPTAGYHRLSALHTSGAPKCVDVAGFSTANGAAVQQYDCGPAWNDNQDWQIVAFTPRAPMTSIKLSGYYGNTVTGVSPGNVPYPTKSYSNFVEHAWWGVSTMPAVLATGVKVKLEMQDALFRLGTRAGGLGQGCTGNIYSTALNQGGLINDPGNTYVDRWNTLKAQILATPGAAAGIAAFYIFDEPYAILSAPNYSNFCDSEIYTMLALVSNLIRSDFPNTPIMVADAPYVIDRVWPASINWIGLSSCYDWPTCHGQPPTYFYGKLKARLQPGQQMVTVPPVSYFRQWCAAYDPSGNCTTWARPYMNPSSPGNVTATEAATTLAEQNQMSGIVDYYIDMMLRDPTYVGMWGWVAPSWVQGTGPSDPLYGVFVGMIDVPRARDKMRFRMRALGFGIP